MKRAEGSGEKGVKELANDHYVLSITQSFRVIVHFSVSLFALDYERKILKCMSTTRTSVYCAYYGATDVLVFRRTACSLHIIYTFNLIASVIPSTRGNVLANELEPLGAMFCPPVAN